MKSFPRIWILLLSFIFLGCRREEIQAYHAPKDAPEEAAPQDSSERPLTWTTPKGWAEQPASGMRIGSFLISGTQGKAEASVVRLAGEAGGTLANINRWRGQMGLNPLAESELGNNTETLEVSGKHALLVNLLGQGKMGPQRILAAIIPRENETFFVKISGEEKLVQSQKKALIEFVKSLK